MKGLHAYILPMIVAVAAAGLFGGCDYLDDFIGPGHDGDDRHRPVQRVGALEFNGSSDYVRVKNDRQLMLSGRDGFTIEAWIRADGWDSWDWIATHARSNSNNDFLFGFDQGRLRFITDNLTNDLTAPTRLEAGRWYHVAGVFNRRSGKMQIYFNGQLDAELALKRGSEVTEADIFIGARESFGTDRPAEFFDGAMHDLRIWTTPLSQADIRKAMVTLYPTIDESDASVALAPTFIARWLMDDGSGHTLTDYSDNDHHGRIYGAEWITVPNPRR